MIILRGISGSGKSTIAQSFKELGAIVCSTDDLFMIDGEYNFEPGRLTQFHDANRVRARFHVRQKDLVVIDNTNTTYKEMKPYIDIAREFNEPVHFLSTKWTDWEDCWYRNIHGVPKEVVKAQNDRFESDSEVLLKYIKGL